MVELKWLTFGTVRGRYHCHPYFAEERVETESLISVRSPNMQVAELGLQPSC